MTNLQSAIELELQRRGGVVRNTRGQHSTPAARLRALGIEPEVPLPALVDGHPATVTATLDRTAVISRPGDDPALVPLQRVLVAEVRWRPVTDAAVTASARGRRHAAVARKLRRLESQ